jgi:hypothetical protein
MRAQKSHIFAPDYLQKDRGRELRALGAKEAKQSTQKLAQRLLKAGPLYWRPGVGGPKADGFVELASFFLRGIRWYMPLPVLRPSPAPPPWPGPYCRRGVGRPKTDGFVELVSFFLRGIRWYAPFRVWRPAPPFHPVWQPSRAHGDLCLLPTKWGQWASMMAIGPTSSEVSLNIRQFSGATPR